MRMYNLMKKLSRFVIVMLAIAMVFMIVAAPSSAVLSGKITVDVGSGYCKGIFQEFNGMSTNNEAIQTKLITSKGTTVVQNIPGAFTTGKLVLKRNATDDMGFCNWRKLVEDGQIQTARKSVTISLLNANGNVSAAWNLTNAWPCSISYDFANSVLTETITLTYESMERKS